MQIESQNCNAQKRQNLFLFCFFFVTAYKCVTGNGIYTPQREISSTNDMRMSGETCEHFIAKLPYNCDNLQLLQYCMKIPGSSLQFKYFSFGQNPPTKNFFHLVQLCSFLRTANIF